MMFKTRVEGDQGIKITERMQVNVIKLTNTGYGYGEGDIKFRGDPRLQM